jgi:acyl dehydratase
MPAVIDPAPQLERLAPRAGQELGVSRWHEVTQERVDAFARVTGDRQWIHTDPERAAQSPFGGTIAHGYLTLSLIPVLLAEAFPMKGFGTVLNYGLNRVRFPAPLTTGSLVRLRARLDSVDGPTSTLTVTFEREGAERPVCVAEVLIRVLEERSEP